MTRKQAVLGIAAGALAAAAAGGVVAVVKYRQGHPHTPETLETLDEVAEHLEVLENVDPAANSPRIRLSSWSSTHKGYVRCRAWGFADGAVGVRDDPIFAVRVGR